MKRIEFLDGLRGVAIILVICFHAFSRWPKIVPYGNLYSDFPVFKCGFLGVQLFFLISGFVILMSLERNNKFLIFIYKRWLRLFPAMLIATILVYITASYLYERPGGVPNLKSVLPGLFFTEPDWVRTITGVKIKPIEGAFWSLFVEFKFYFIFGLCYFLFGKEKSIIAIFSMFIISLLGLELNIHPLNVFCEFFSFLYFGWFTSGALAYLYFISKKHKYLYLSILVGLLEILQYRNDLKILLFSIFILLLFFIPIYFERTRVLLSNPTILFFGFISYPLYLIHENAMIALICKISKVVEIPYILL
ncbi:acyltransferase, partial [Flavobacterium sp.]|uniref:acyltransferase family protein n=1 Tax=Flavobacterium sp. TaxID=239 RepID=UPI00261106E5